jgi:type VI protein secretion system component VasF
MSTAHDQPIIPQPTTPPTPRERRGNRTAWTIVVVLVALLAAVLFYGKQSRDREDQTAELACAMQADAAGASSWQIIDGRCVTR